MPGAGRRQPARPVSPFLTPMRAEYIPPWTYYGNGWQPNNGTSCWQLTEPFQLYSRVLGRTVVCETGFRFDKASVPGIGILYGEFGDRFLRAACGHDKLCRERRVKRNRADRAFLEWMRAEIAEELDAMREAGIDDDEIADMHARLEGRAQLMYAAVVAYTKSGLWKTEVDRPGFEPIA